jgi:hypothetical protein
VLMSEHYARAGYAFARCLAALTACGLLLITLQLPLAAGQAEGYRCQWMFWWGRAMFAYHPVRERMTVGGLEELRGSKPRMLTVSGQNTIYV